MIQRDSPYARQSLEKPMDVTLDSKLKQRAIITLLIITLAFVVLRNINDAKNTGIATNRENVVTSSPAETNRKPDLKSCISKNSTFEH